LFRHDLRLADNPALHAAVGRPIIPIYVFDEDSPGVRAPGGASRWWLHGSLASLARDLAALGSRLHILRGPASELVPALAAAAGASHVFWNRRYDGAGVAIDAAIKARLRAEGVDARSFKAQLLHEPWEVETKAGGPYGVFSPFWRAALQRPEPEAPLPAPKALSSAPWPKGAPRRCGLDDLALLPRRPDWAGGLRERWEPGEAGAYARLRVFLSGPLAEYADQRDRPDCAATSFLSPHLAFGEISPRQIWRAVRFAVAARAEFERPAGKFLSEVGWREFSYHLLYHNPDLARTNYNARFDDFPWTGPDPDALTAWRMGRTGFPIVDAGMRELWRTGYMHNRVRMIAASFLVKNLLVDWREGEAWFWDTLCDADPANNAASWQWVAGSGADAAPYFRIFNPVLQGEKFDPSGAYVRAHAPELAGVPDRYVHKPWLAPASVLDRAGLSGDSFYRSPMVDLAASRDRALTAFKALPART